MLSVLTMTPKTLDLNWRKPVTVASHLDSGLQVHFAGMLKHDMYPKRSEGSITHRTGVHSIRVMGLYWAELTKARYTPQACTCNLS